MKKTTLNLSKYILAIFCIATMFPSVKQLSAKANSAQPYWYGTTAFGEVVVSGQSPLVVEKEKLIFNVPEFPKMRYQIAEDFLAYSASATAEYTFYNPSDLDITATLAFPFGEYPSYGKIDRTEYVDDNGKYDVKLNGEIVEKKIRYTWDWDTPNFDIYSEIQKMKTDYLELAFFAPDSPVYKYTYRLSGLDTAQTNLYENEKWQLSFEFDKTKSSFINPIATGVSTTENGLNFQFKADEGKEVELFVIGEEIPLYESKITAFEYTDKSITHILSGETVLIKKEQTTLLDVVMTYCDIKSQDAQMDWYNYCMQEYTREVAEENRIKNGYVKISKYSSPEPMRWYEYQINVPPKSSAVNAITVPIYPTIHNLDGYNKYLAYEYSYLLSPAKTWAEFGAIEIQIHTPYTLTDSIINAFEKTEYGNLLNLDGLPDSELEFELREPKNIEKERKAKAFDCFGCFSATNAIFPVLLLATIFVSIYRRKN